MIPFLVLLAVAATSSFPSELNQPRKPGLQPENPKAQPHEQPKEKGRPKLILPRDREQLPAGGPLYLFPGAVSIKDGGYSGSDNFINISKDIPVIITIRKPEGFPLNISEFALKEKVLEVFRKGGLSTEGAVKPGRAPLPVFNLVVLLYQLEEGYVGALQARLLEQVTLDRVHLPKDTFFQAITWEQQNLILGPKEEFEKILNQAALGISENFIRRLIAYQTPRGSASASNE